MTQIAFDYYGIAYVNCKKCEHFIFVNTESCRKHYDLYPRTCDDFEEKVEEE